MTSYAAVPVPPREARVVLGGRGPGAGEGIEVVVLPGSGADIYSVTDLATGVDVLWKSPWGWRDPRTIAPLGSSQDDWLARCAGGWSTLVPNAGPERVVAGSRLGYHGEAAVISWTVEASSPSSVRLSARLTTAPLHLVRHVEVAGRSATVRQTVRNVGRVPFPVRWVEHPAFGAPFAGHGAELILPAATFVADSDAPGTDLVPGTVATLNRLTDRAGRPFPLAAVPDASTSRALFGALTDLAEPAYSLRSDHLGLGVRVEWDAEALPHAWVWQEIHASDGHPWWRSAYAVAVEPANVLPGEGRGGRPPVLAPGAEQSAVVRLTLT